MSYESFSINMKNDKYFFDKTVGYNKEVMIKKVQDEVNATRMLEDKKRQEIIDKLAALKKELYRLDTGAKNLSLIDEEILFSQVDDHLEINPEFISQLKYLDLALINFAGVKVSGLDFSGSNASIDPQLVYKKDMSYGKYDGLNFISSDFSGVNISGASFEGCNMDFAMMDGAINDTGYGK